jgi:hypothetical protein
MNNATAFGMQMFSGAKNAFAFGKQKISSLTGSADRVDARSSNSGSSRYKDNGSDSDDSDDNWFVDLLI